MEGDRSWMRMRKKRRDDLHPREFLDGCERFVEHALRQGPMYVKDNKIRCPCVRCANQIYEMGDVVLRHLINNGFMRGYEDRWYAHGETTRAVNEEVDVSGSNRMVDMVMDQAGPNFEWDQDRSEPMNSGARHFFEALDKGSQPLYPGCTNHSQLSVVAQLLCIKSDCNTSQECFNRTLDLIKSILPAEAVLPDNYYYAKQMVKSMGLGYKKIQACPNDCMLYYGEDEHKTECTVCGHDRYKPKTGNPSKKTDTPHKVLRYFPIKDRLKRLYLSKHTAEEMTWHARRPVEEGVLNHPADGNAWKHFDRTYPEFAADPRNVRLGLSTDGFNPFGHSAVPYSCWPVILTPYNLPPWMCMKQPYLFLSLLIPGPKSPGKDLDVYMRPLIDELKELWEHGSDTWDVAAKQNFKMRAAVMWTISDFPAYGMLSGWSTHGKMSCPHCMEHTKAFTLKHGRKPCWFDCHRRFLPTNHQYRRNRDHWRKGKVERDDQPPRLSGQDVLQRVIALPEVPHGKMVASQTLPGYGEDHHWTRRCILWELPYWENNMLRHNLDPMHIEKNVHDNVNDTVMDVAGRTKDNAKARHDMADICKRPTLELVERADGKTVKPRAKFVLTKEQIKDVCTWIKLLRLPDGYSSNISRCVRDGKLIGMKSHDCHVFLEKLLPIAYRDVLDKQVWEALTELSNFFRGLCSTVLHEKDLNILEKNIAEVLCKLEKIFPPGFFDSMEHLPIHLPYEASLGGPVQYRWMYPFERAMQHLKKKVKNRACVEGSICEAYSIEKVAAFTSSYFPDKVLRKATRVPRNDDGDQVSLNGRVLVFGQTGRSFGKSQRLFLGQSLKHAAHTYVLLNCDEIDEHLRYVCCFQCF